MIQSIVKFLAFLQELITSIQKSIATKRLENSKAQLARALKKAHDFKDTAEVDAFFLNQSK